MAATKGYICLREYPLEFLCQEAPEGLGGRVQLVAPAKKFILLILQA